MKKLLIALASIMILLVVMILIIPVLVPIREFKSQTEKAISQKINGNASIADMELSTFPWLGIRIQGLVIQSDEMFNQEELLQIQEAGIQFQVMPLLKKKIVGIIRLDQPVIRIITRYDEKKNINEIVKKSPPKTTAPKSDTSKELPAWINEMIQTARFQELSITQGQLRTLTMNRDLKASTQGLEIQKLSLRLDNLSPQGTIPTSFSAAVFNPYEPDISFQGNLVTNLNLTQKKYDINIDAGKLALGDIQMSLTGNILQNPPSSPEASAQTLVDIKLNSKGIALGRLEKNIPILKAKLPRDLSGDLGFQITAKGPTAPFEKLIIDYQFNSNLISWAPNSENQSQKLRLENFELKGKVKEGNVHINLAKANLLNGNWNSKGRVNLAKEESNTPLSFDIKTQLENIDINEALTVFNNQKDILFGQFSTDIRTQGTPSTAIPDNFPSKSWLPYYLQAEGKFNIGPGRLSTLNLLNQATKTLLAFAPLEPDMKKRFQQVNWERVEGTLRIKESTVHLEPVNMIYDVAMFTTQGKIDPKKNNDMKGTAIFPKKVADNLGPHSNWVRKKDGSLQIPFTVRGTMDKPKVQFDAKNFVKEAIKQNVKEFVPKEAKEDIKNITKPFSDLLKPKKQ